MKRTYIIPSMMVVLMQAKHMVALSGVTSDNGIGFGGLVGEDDGIIPEVKTYTNTNIWGTNIWDEEW